MTVRPAPGQPISNVRLIISNDGGNNVDLHLYTEVTDPQTEVVRFESYNSENNSTPGELHGLPISTPYLTKDYLQSKRFLAQSAGTTYCYDLPDLFRQQLEKVWARYVEDHSDGKI